MSKSNNSQRVGKPKKAVPSKMMTRTLASRPSAFTAQAVRSFKIRMVASAAVSGYQVLMSDLGGMLGVIAKSATTSQYLSSLTRVRRITMWGPVATAGTPVTVQWTWSNNSEDFETPPSTKMDTSVSYDHPAFLNLTPPKMSLSSKWHSSGLADALGVIGCPAGTTVDLDLDWVLCDGPSTPYVAGPTLIGATVGDIYHHPFSNFTALGLNSL
jgi:hypothetical protein